MLLAYMDTMDWHIQYHPVKVMDEKMQEILQLLTRYPDVSVSIGNLTYHALTPDQYAEYPERP